MRLVTRICARDGCDNRALPNRLYCSDEHARSAVTKPRRLCAICGKPVKVVRASYCSRECYKAKTAPYMDDLRQLAASGSMPTKDIAAKLGITPDALYEAMARHSIENAFYHRMSAEQIEILKSRYPTYDDKESIIAAMNAVPGSHVTQGALEARADRLGLKRPADFRSVHAKRTGHRPPPSPKGVLPPNFAANQQKLHNPAYTPELMEDVRAKRMAGKSASVIAGEVGLRRIQVTYLLNKLGGGPWPAVVSRKRYPRRDVQKVPAVPPRVFANSNGAPKTAMQEVKKRPEKIPLREVIRLAREYGCKADIESLSRAVRRIDPTHAGFRPAEEYRLSRAWR